MTTVKADLIEGAACTVSKDGSTATRVFHVSDLGLASDVTASYVLQAAIDAPGIPIMGAIHPTIPEIVVQSVSAAPLGAGQIIAVTVSYSAPATKNNPPQLGEKPRIELGTSLVAGKTQKGYSLFTGKQVDLTLTPDAATKLPPQTAMVDVSIPLSTIRYTRRESTDPRAVARKYVGKINKNITGIYPKHSLLCSAITGSSDDGGATYVVTYEFQDNPDGWDIDVVYLIDNNPVSVPSVRLGTLAHYAVYADIDFNKLGL